MGSARSRSFRGWSIGSVWSAVAHVCGVGKTLSTGRSMTHVYPGGVCLKVFAHTFDQVESRTCGIRIPSHLGICKIWMIYDNTCLWGWYLNDLDTSHIFTNIYMRFVQDGFFIHIGRVGSRGSAWSSSFFPGRSLGSAQPSTCLV